ncbi:MAG TPA: M48 family metalloprotease, partial [Tahibacter sp.]|nr:M48 family metalloprotease [Tahibacter sp.]
MRNWFIALLSLCAAGPTAARESGVRLPDIGSSASAIMTPQEQRAYGASMLHEMRSYTLVLDDPLLVDYLNALGYRLVAHSDKPEQAYTFFVVRDPAINAFAAPGGYIGVNAGLITTAVDEGEVAAVLAHEIAHISQNHLLRAFEDSQKASLPIALAMLGAMIASQGASGDGAEAAMVAGTSLI